MTTLADLQGFDLQNADVSVWVFKTSSLAGLPKFNGRWIGITDDLEAELRGAVGSRLADITETIEYGILAQNNEGSALTIMSDETHVHQVSAEVANETAAKKVKNIKHLANSKFYVIKFVNEHGSMLAIRKTDSSWGTRKTGGMIKMIYSDDELDIDRQPTFNIQPFFDFYVLNDQIFIDSKPRFESVLHYKAGHEDAFETLKAEPEFSTIFADMAPISDFVGANKIQLRRAIAIQEKGHYKNPDFMNRLRAECAAMNLTIAFDDEGRIIPSAESCRHIFQALLDHRLDSRLSSLMYDVQNTAPVG